MPKTCILIWLEDNEVKELEKIAEALSDAKAKAEVKNKVPPSKRGHKVSRSKAGRMCLLKGMEWAGVITQEAENKPLK
jgi:hypothetical protein